MIVSVPDELDNDHMQVMNIVENKTDQMVTAVHLMDALEWDEERAQRALDLLLGKGMAWIDEHRGVASYWFPR